MNYSKNNYRPILVIAPGILAGAEKVVLSGVEALYQAGLNPLVIIIMEKRVPNYALEFQANIPAYIDNKMIVSKNAIDLTLLYKLNKIWRDEELKPIIHTHGFKALITCLFSNRNHIHIHTHHGNTSHTFKVRIYEKMAFFAMKKCDYLIAVSKKMTEELKNTLVPYKNILMIENLLSIKNHKEIRTLRKKTIKDEKILNLIFIGRLSPEKGILNFLEYFSRYKSKDLFHLTILGDGIDDKLIRTIIEKNKLNKYVSMEGYVSNIFPFLISTDVLIMPSLTEGLPLTLIEALSVGIPVIANGVGGIPSLIKNNFNGLLTKDNTYESWCEALNIAQSNYKKWNNNALSDSEKILNRFSAKIWASNTKKLYNYCNNE